MRNDCVNLKFRELFKFSKSVFPSGIYGCETIRFLVSDPCGVVMVPESISEQVASHAGVDVPYVERPRMMFRNF